MSRTDVHRPSVIVPADYDFVAFECVKIEGIEDCLFLREERARLRRHMERTGGTFSHHDHGGNCHICGSVNLIYSILFYHTPSNSYIRCGEECANNLEHRGFDHFKKQIADARAHNAGKAKAQAILTDAGLSKAWDIFSAAQKQATEVCREETMLIDIVNKLVTYGSLSDKQLAFIGRLTDQIVRRPEILAQRAAETAAAAPVPVTDKRMTVCGKVLSIRTPNYDQGECGPIRMLVQHDSGWKVWGSVPSCFLPDLKVGTVVRFDAAVKPSDKDNKFGFFSRPTKAEILNTPVAA